MSCGFDKDLLQEFAVGEVTAEERQETEAHLVACHSCRSEVAGLRHLARDLASLPEPEFPAAMEETLIRISIQAARSLTPARAPGRPRFVWRPAWVVGLGSTVGVGVLVLIVVLLWPGRLSSWAPFNNAVNGGVGHGLGLLDGIMRWFTDLRSAWNWTSDLFARFAPVQKAMRVAFSSVGGSVWAALLLGAVGTVVLLWRVISGGQRKIGSVGHAKSQN